MRRYFTQGIFRCTFDTEFETVIRKCRKKIRNGQDSSWITDEIEESFIELHNMGYAHSVEVWQEDNLIGGLYGVALGHVFFGESMFADVSNASKFGLIKLCQYLEHNDYWMIDCQQATEHLKSMGGQLISKDAFFSQLKKNALHQTKNKKWTDY